MCLIRFAGGGCAPSILSAFGKLRPINMYLARRFRENVTATPALQDNTRSQRKLREFASSLLFSNLGEFGISVPNSWCDLLPREWRTRCIVAVMTDDRIPRVGAREEGRKKRCCKYRGIEFYFPRITSRNREGFPNPRDSRVSRSLSLSRLSSQTLPALLSRSFEIAG